MMALSTARIVSAVLIHGLPKTSEYAFYLARGGMMDATKNDGEYAETRHVRFLPLHSIRPSPENDRIYRPIDPSAPDILALRDSILEFGIKEPLVVTMDHYIISGHRRHCAARL